MFVRLGVVLCLWVLTVHSLAQTITFSPQTEQQIVNRPWRFGIDGLIVADPGVLSLCLRSDRAPLGEYLTFRDSLPAGVHVTRNDTGYLGFTCDDTASMSAALASIDWHTAPDRIGTTALRGEVTAVCPASTLSAAFFLSVIAMPANTPPTVTFGTSPANTSPAPLTFTEGTPAVVYSLRLDDAGSTLPPSSLPLASPQCTAAYSLSISTAEAPPRPPPGQALPFSVSLSGQPTGATVASTAPLSALNRALTAGLATSPPAGFWGAYSVAVAVNDSGNAGSGGPLVGGLSYTVVVPPASTLPRLAVPSYVAYTVLPVVAAFRLRDPAGPSAWLAVEVRLRYSGDTHAPGVIAASGPLPAGGVGVVGNGTAEGRNGTYAAVNGTWAALSGAWWATDFVRFSFSPALGNRTGSAWLEVVASSPAGATAVAVVPLRRILQTATPSRTPTASGGRPRDRGPTRTPTRTATRRNATATHTPTRTRSGNHTATPTREPTLTPLTQTLTFTPPPVPTRTRAQARFASVPAAVAVYNTFVILGGNSSGTLRGLAAAIPAGLHVFAPGMALVGDASAVVTLIISASPPAGFAPPGPPPPAVADRFSIPVPAPAGVVVRGVAAATMAAPFAIGAGPVEVEGTVRGIEAAIAGMSYGVAPGVGYGVGAVYAWFVGDEADFVTVAATFTAPPTNTPPIVVPAPNAPSGVEGQGVVVAAPFLSDSDFFAPGVPVATSPDATFRLEVWCPAWVRASFVSGLGTTYNPPLGAPAGGGGCWPRSGRRRGRWRPTRRL